MLSLNVNADDQTDSEYYEVTETSNSQVSGVKFDQADGIGEVADDLEVTEAACAQCIATNRCPGVCRDPGHPRKPLLDRPGDRDKGDCPPLRYRIDDCQRSGNPSSVYKWAKPSITDKYSAWYVGGGAWFKGRGRTAEEGTWGLDYDGFFGHARTWLNYSCGKRKGGEGAYQTDHVSIKAKLSALH